MLLLLCQVLLDPERPSERQPQPPSGVENIPSLVYKPFVDIRVLRNCPSRPGLLRRSVDFPSFLFMILGGSFKEVGRMYASPRVLADVPIQGSQPWRAWEVGSPTPPASPHAATAAPERLFIANYYIPDMEGLPIEL